MPLLIMIGCAMLGAWAGYEAGFEDGRRAQKEADEFSGDIMDGIINDVARKTGVSKEAAEAFKRDMAYASPSRRRS